MQYEMYLGKRMSSTWLNKMRLREEKSQSEVAESLGISQSQYSRYEANPDDLPFNLLRALTVLLRFDLSEVGGDNQSVEEIDLGDPYEAQRKQLRLLRQFIAREGDARTSSEKAASMGVDVPTIEEFRNLIGKYDHKPNIVFAGRFDTGKSYLANQILGGDFLPSAYQPTTRLLSIIRHISEKPEWQDQPVAFLQQDFWKIKGDHHYDLSFLGDRKRYKYCTHQATLHSLNEHGIFLHGRQRRQRKQFEQLNVDAAVIYIDSPLLLSCNIVDTPGFSDFDVEGLEEARLQPIKELMDVLVYTSTTSGFMDARDQAYLKYLLSLSDRGFERFPEHPTLGNVFIVSTLASPQLIGDKELASLLENGADRLSTQIGESVLKVLRANTQRQYSMKELDRRFFSFWAQANRRHKKLRDQLVSYLSKTLPDTYLSNFENDINEFKRDSAERLSQAIGYYQKVRDDVEGARIKYQTIMEYEKDRTKEVNRETRSLIVFIRSLKSSAKDSLRTKAQNLLTVSSLKTIISKKYGDDKKEAKENAPLLIFSKLEAATKDMVSDDYNKKFRPQLESFVKMYSLISFEPEMDKPGSIDIPFNFRRLFIDALVGGSAIAIGSTFGPIGLAAGLGIAFFSWVVNRQAWQERLAKQIIDSFEKKRCVAQLENGVEQFWNGVEDSFETLVEKAEEDWDRSVKELAKMIDIDSLQTAEENINHLRVLCLFFEKIRWNAVE